VRNQQGAARTKGEAKVTLMAAATMRACKSPYLALAIFHPLAAGGISKQPVLEQRSCHSRNTTTIGNCCEKRASPSLFTGSQQRDQPRGECRLSLFFFSKIFVAKRLRKARDLAWVSMREKKERGLTYGNSILVETEPCENIFSLRLAFVQ